MRSILSLLFGLSMFLFAGVASATPTTIASIPGEDYGVFKYGFETMTLTYAGRSDNVAAGVYTMSVDGVATNLICVDIADNLFSPGTFTPGSMSQPLSGELSKLLWNTQSGMDGKPNPSSSLISAAIQVAAWEIEYPGVSITNVDPAVLSLASNYVSNTLLGGFTAPAAAVMEEYYSTPAGNQNLAFLDTFSVPVNEPFIPTVMGVGLIALWFATKRSQKHGGAA